MIELGSDAHVVLRLFRNEIPHSRTSVRHEVHATQGRMVMQAPLHGLVMSPTSGLRMCGTFSLLSLLNIMLSKYMGPLPHALYPDARRPPLQI